MLSSLVRSSIFFATNLAAGLDAALAALTTELLFRGVSAGFYGALTQSFRDVRPAWVGTTAAMVVLPTISHLIEFFVHYISGTARLADSVAASVAFTCISTAFHLFAMRRNTLTVGAGSHSLRHDLRHMPGLLLAFLQGVIRGLSHSWRRVRLAPWPPSRRDIADGPR